MANKKPGWTPPVTVDDPEEPSDIAPAGAVLAETEPAMGGALSSRRPLLLIAIFIVLLVAVVVRLVHWTVFPTTAQASARAEAPAQDPVRGRIVDRNGMLMATDTFLGKVYARPMEMSKSTELAATTFFSTSLALGLPPEALRASLAITDAMAVLTTQASVDQCDAINRIKQPNLVWCDFARERRYPQGTVGAHLLGFLNVEHIGLYGVEARYDNWLNKELRWQGNVPDAPQPLPESWQVYLPSPAGHDLMLNLDVPLQYVVERRLLEAIALYQAEAGTIIVMDPRTGALLAMANYPTFDPGQFSDVPKDYWVNPAISEIYEPGSVFKIVTMAAGIDSEYVTPDMVFVDEGRLDVVGRPVRNAELRTYGPVTVRDALAKSINVVSAKVSLRMGADTFYSYVRQFGFGRLTEVDLQSEVGGIVKVPGGADWSPFDQATNSFGQGISVTALQMINAAAAIAHEGVLLQPQVVGAMIEDGKMHRIPPRIMGRPIRPETARKLTQMMVYTVESSSTPNPVPGYRVAGKTGTAEIPTKEGYVSVESIMSFIGFLPAADPQLIIMVKLVKPKVGIWAEQVAVPVFAKVGKDAVQILEIKPDERKP